MSRNIHPLIIALVIIIGAGVYLPGLSGGFEFDDEANIVRNQPLLITEITPATLKQATYSMQAGTLMRPISYLTLALNHYFTGLDPLYFKLTNLLIHLLNGLAIYWLSRQLLLAVRHKHQPALTLHHIRWISLAASAFWLLHPLGLTSVLYVVQRMNSLSALFVLLGLTTYCWGRNQQINGRSGRLAIVASVIVFTPLATLSKENGALLPFLMLLVEAILFRFDMPRKSDRRWLLTYFTLIAFIPALLITGFLITHIDWWFSTYTGRDFTLSERLLTQARVLWFYLTMVVVPNISQLGLYHDDFTVSSGLLSPPTTGLALFGLSGLLVCAWVCRKRAPVVALGILFFLAGHSMESSIFALEMVHEHRNYLPMYGIVLPLAYYLFHPSLPSKTGKARILLGLAFIGMLSITTTIRAGYWGNPLKLALVEVHNHPDSARSQYRLGQLYWQLMEFKPERATHYSSLAREHFQHAMAADPSDTSGLFALVMLDARRNHPIKNEHLAELSQRLRYRPFSGSSHSQIRDLGECLAKGLCRMQNEEINLITLAALDNPTLRGITRAKVVSEIMVIALIQGDLNRALILGEEATKIDSDDPQHWLNYTSLLIQSDQLKKAQTIIQMLNELDLQPFLKPRLIAQEEALREAGLQPRNQQ